MGNMLISVLMHVLFAIHHVFYVQEGLVHYVKNVLH